MPTPNTDRPITVTKQQVERIAKEMERLTGCDTESVILLANRPIIIVDENRN